MIPRPKPTAPAPGAFTVAPRGDGLPVLTLPAPPETPEAAAAAADDYAREYAHRLGLDAHRLAVRAYGAMLRAIPGLHRQDVIARMHGINHRADLGAH